MMTTRPALSLARLCPHAAAAAAARMPNASLAMLDGSTAEMSVNTTRGYEEIPAPRGWPVIGTGLSAVWNGVITRLHEYIDMRYRQLGPIYREKLGNIDAVFLFDPKDVQTVFRREGKHPNHFIPEAWTMHRDITQKPRGLFFMDGEHWQSRRRVMNQLLLHPKVVPQYADRINDTVDDLIARWSTIKKGHDNVVDKVEVEMFNWSIECIGTVIFDQRMGCLSENRPNDIQQFVRSIQEIFRTTMILTMIPPKIAKFLRLPVWKRFLHSMDLSLAIARKYISMSIERVMARMDAGENVNDFCSGILAHKDFDLDEVVRLTTDLFAGAADTVSNAMAWALYLISQNPAVQEKIYHEVSQIVPVTGQSITPEMLKQMKYVQAVMKETLRLYPVAPFHTRYLDEDITIKGYNIPANTLIMMGTYSMGRDEKNFERASEFIPERWFRDRSDPDDRENNLVANYATMPFAFGPRCCVGRRLAETEMHMLLAKLVQKFKIEYASDKPVDIDLRMITAPKQSIKLRFIERQPQPSV
ncbi:1,25-dihydroxyvitamin D(3) 24-hydroxylase, mitochondrial-like [Paramacrobiotus metropolitanus]|uniref:1,25-dihydroxyvitamin D(3) 24-hydroxylase, mitochondrial-like n=1 Tax=Paramacrobiotus metropolitanus TaxID=2943436 RepID=UPI0024462DAF|nr:1,25-dihydroxyvitamin D(3) 24-hydroxylase, mitochondrial-like [Paramacrobiotus metropolitanus]